MTLTAAALDSLVKMTQLIGIPIGIAVFGMKTRKERVAREYATYDTLDCGTLNSSNCAWPIPISTWPIRRGPTRTRRPNRFIGSECCSPFWRTSRAPCHSWRETLMSDFASICWPRPKKNADGHRITLSEGETCVAVRRV